MSTKKLEEINARRTRKLNRASKIETITLDLLSFLNVIKVYHWRTSDYNVHVNTDELVESMTKHVDKFIENYLGMNNINPRSKRFDFSNIHTTKLVIIEDIPMFRKYLEKFKHRLMKNITDKDGVTSVLIRDDMLESVNKSLYLLSLK